MAVKTIKSPDSAISAVETRSFPPIQKTKTFKGGPIRALVLTSNPLKQEEFKSFLGSTYGMELTFRAPPEELTQEIASKTFSEKDFPFSQIRKILSEERVTAL